MAPRELGPGEAAERASKRRFWTILGILFAAGFAVGLGSAIFETDDSGPFTGTLPPLFALIAAIVTAVAMIVGSALFYRKIDEVERQDNLVAGAWGAHVMLGVYPVWFLLWKGGWVPEPMHAVLFVAMFAIVTIAYLYRKFV